MHWFQKDKFHRNAYAYISKMTCELFCAHTSSYHFQSMVGAPISQHRDVDVEWWPSWWTVKRFCWWEKRCKSLREAAGCSLAQAQMSRECADAKHGSTGVATNWLSIISLSIMQPTNAIAVLICVRSQVSRSCFATAWWYNLFSISPIGLTSE